MLTDTARKKFRFQIAPSDRQLWAIGMVVVQWSSVETMITIYAHAFTGEKSPAREQFDRTRALDVRIDQLEDLAKQNTLPQWRERVLGIINEARQVKELRDKIVHGMWGGKENISANDMGAHGPFKFARPNKPNSAFSWKLNYGDILKVAVRIDAVHFAMTDLCFSAHGPIPPGQGVILSDALKRIQHKPNPAS